MASDLQNGQLTTMGLLRPKTNIDRRSCKRVVPMKVICLGLCRTGTSSLRAALFELGLNDVYHMFSVTTENPLDAELWKEAYDAKYKGIGKPYGKEEFDALLGHCMATTDFPGISFAPELLAAYPDAKVILTVRDNGDVWYDSVFNTIWTVSNFLRAPPKTLTQRLVQAILPKPHFNVFEHTPLGNFPVEGRQWYDDWNEDIRTRAKGREFLEFNVKQGWGPLCEFLGVEQPKAKFPRVNDSASFKETHNNDLLRVGAKVVAALSVLGLAVWLAKK
ncbi:uncharacterized protein BP5553_08806 [Venustampulla echinocandica]|uniref:P-loop containing nucleoside triphosphate hydrolase n=1 Tax=Venustampulla echinocandica TaxID=2656787 RepID=A0A370TD11_9HELO|nr:uncharacterized protein BP5553_08806 [Venustampulla echinocandica]RDL32350.1 hypothetical protein BP5553_08806 [Venustampulla echinocandica]